MSYSKLTSIFRALTTVAVASIPVSKFSSHCHQKKFAQQQLSACLARSALLIISHLESSSNPIFIFFPAGKPHFHSKLLEIVLLYSACGTHRLSWLLPTFMVGTKRWQSTAQPQFPSHHLIIIRIFLQQTLKWVSKSHLHQWIGEVPPCATYIFIRIVQALCFTA